MCRKLVPYCVFSWGKLAWLHCKTFDSTCLVSDNIKLNLITFYLEWGVRDRVVRVVDLRCLAHTAISSNPDRDFGFFYVRKVSI